MSVSFLEVLLYLLDPLILYIEGLFLLKIIIFKLSLIQIMCLIATLWFFQILILPFKCTVRFPPADLGAMVTCNPCFDIHLNVKDYEHPFLP